MYKTIKYIFIYEDSIKTKTTKAIYNNENILVTKIKYILLLIFISFIIFYKQIINNDEIEAIFAKKLSKKKALDYMNICLKEILLYNISFNVNNFPKISVVIPLYNCEKNIKYTIRSVQNQNIKNIEIILINDNSKDGSLNVIKSLQKEDKRIKILNNNKNMGTLYSRSIGTLMSKGAYIFPLDNDDMFSNEDIFENIYDIAQNQKFDIVEFKTFDVPNYINKKKKLSDNFFNHHPHNLILHQPELNLFPISKNDEYYENDYHVWGKCIISKLYKKAINALGKKRYSIYNCWTEDIIILLIIFKYANSFIFINKYGIIHMENNVTTTYSLDFELKIISEINLLEIIIDFLKETPIYEKYAVSKALSLGKMNIIPYMNETNKLYLKKVLNKLMNNKFINDDDKNKINDIFNITL